MKISIIVCAFALADELERLVDSTSSTKHEIGWQIFLHSQVPAVMEAVKRISGWGAVTVYPYGINRGLSKSWNQGMIRAFDDGADVVVLANDDLILADGDLDTLVEYAYARRATHYAAAADGYDHRQQKQKTLGFSFAAFNRIALERVGCFDENLIPAYYEDVDYARRAALSGLQLGYCHDVQAQHLGSASIYRAKGDDYEGLSYAMGMCKDYYTRKWGGDFGQELYLLPFNQPTFGYLIPPSRRMNPYGMGFDRVDWVAPQAPQAGEID